MTPLALIVAELVPKLALHDPPTYHWSSVIWIALILVLLAIVTCFIFSNRSRSENTKGRNVNDPHNWTPYSSSPDGKDSTDKEKIHKYYLFPKSNSTINRGFWCFNDLGRFYYTTPSEEVPTTLDTIHRYLRGKCQLVDDYFEAILSSHVCEENEELLETLMKQVPGGLLLDDCGVRVEIPYLHQYNQLLPDLVLTDIATHHTILISAYNGSNAEEVRTKLCVLRDAFPLAEIYVFSTHLSTHEPTTKLEFSFHRHTTMAEGSQHVSEIRIGKLVIDSEKMLKEYGEEMMRFFQQHLHWRRCIREGKLSHS